LRIDAGELVAASMAPGEKRRLLRWSGAEWTVNAEQPDANIEDFASVSRRRS
jgi:hypothetical protein